jgi:predicted transcriptional regulator
MTLDTTLVVRFPSEVKEALQRAADADNRSMSSMALIIIREGLQDRRYLDKPRKPVRSRGRK